MGLYPFPQYLVWLIRKSGFPQENDEDEDNLEAQLEGQTAENPGGQFGNFFIFTAIVLSGWNVSK